jgi:hypothetical protein
MRFFFQSKVLRPAEPELTVEDYLSMADADLKIACERYSDACRAVASWNARHPEYAWIDGKIVRQFIPNDPEWLAIKTRESQTHDVMRKAMERRAELVSQYGKPETRWIGGKMVNP